MEDPTLERQAQNKRAVRRIQFLLDNNRLSVHEAAVRLSVRQPVLQAVLDGRSLPTEALLRKIAAYFEIDFEFLSSDGREPEIEPAPRASSAPAAAADKSPPASSKLDLRTLAIRHQALLETLVKKGLISAAEYRLQVEEVQSRGTSPR